VPGGALDRHSDVVTNGHGAARAADRRVAVGDHDRRGAASGCDPRAGLALLDGTRDTQLQCVPLGVDAEHDAGDPGRVPGLGLCERARYTDHEHEHGSGARHELSIHGHSATPR
jgi:hypothetical protein